MKCHAVGGMIAARQKKMGGVRNHLKKKREKTDRRGRTQSTNGKPKRGNVHLTLTTIVQRTWEGWKSRLRGKGEKKKTRGNCDEKGDSGRRHRGASSGVARAVNSGVRRRWEGIREKRMERSAVQF